jgi:hypothetical protein
LISTQEVPALSAAVPAAHWKLTVILELLPLPTVAVKVTLLEPKVSPQLEGME